MFHRILSAVQRVGVVLVILGAIGSLAMAQGQTGLLDDTPRLAVISAFGPELQLLLEQADIDTTYVIGGTTYHVGKLGGNDVVMFLSGVSMVNAAMKTQAAVDHFNITGVVFSGIAGGVDPSLNIGDVTVPGQ
jgi:adenosylhomocysteine nucleosidase